MTAEETPAWMAAAIALVFSGRMVIADITICAQGGRTAEALAQRKPVNDWLH